MVKETRIKSNFGFMKRECMKKDFYQSAIKEAPIGYACHKIICDESGEPSDYEFIDVNPEFSEMFSLGETQVIGKRFSEIFPRLYEEKPEWLQITGDIAVNGDQTKLELYSADLGKSFRIKIISPEKYYFITYIIDTSEESEQSEALKNLTAVLEEPEENFLNPRKEKSSWRNRLDEIADFLRLENDQQFRRIIENLPFSLNVLSLDGIILFANEKCKELFKLEESHIGKRTFINLWVDPANREHWLEAMVRESMINDYEMHLKTAAGEEFWAIGSGMLIEYQGRTCILSTQIDITERKRMESALKISEEKYRLLTEFTSDVIWVFNLKKLRYSYISPSIYYLTGYTAEEAQELGLLDSLTAESAFIVRESIEQHLQEFITNPENRKSYILEIRQKCKSGDVIWVEISTKYRFNDRGDIEIVGVSRNIEERKRAEREVLYLSYHDQLTGLYNRRFFEEELERINFQSNMPLTLVIADVNGLKLTNDAFGHFSGDDLLKRFASVLNRELGAEDVAARIGGDEFVLLLPKTDSLETELLVNRIKEGIGREKTEHAILSVSFGWATKETVGEDFGTLFIQAEENMYHSKLAESSKMKSDTIRKAMGRLYEKNPMEEAHSQRVAKLCREIGKALGLQGSELMELSLLGTMHDIGKIAISDEILNKQEPLNETEWLEIRRHPEVGYQILRSAIEYVPIAEAVLAHHERADGTGYPRKLRLDEIPLHARILAIAEAYDIMLYGNPYGKPRKKEVVINELLENSGKQFDADLVRIFIEQVAQ